MTRTNHGDQQAVRALSRPGTISTRAAFSVAALVVLTVGCGESRIATELESATDPIAYLRGLDVGDGGAKVDAGASDGASGVDDGAAVTPTDAGGTDDGGSEDGAGLGDGVVADADVVDDDTADAASDAASSGGCPGQPGCPCQSIADCDDKNPCTGPDSCVAGKCAPAKQITCKDDDPCTEDFCSKKLGCQNKLKDGLTCNDGDVCTWGDACKAGACKGTAKKCDDANPCTNDSCDKAQGCKSVPKKEGESCNDGSACTKNDVCKANKCTGVGKVCKDNDPCTEDSCDAKGNCMYTKVQDGTVCNDGDKCTFDDICKSAKCGGKKDACDDKKPCTADSCSTTKGCLHVALKPGAACEDNDKCTKSTTCQSGQCKGSPIVCDDDSICTADGCDPKEGCNTTPVGEGVTCAKGKVCKVGKCLLTGGCPSGGYKGTLTLVPSGKGTFATFAEANKQLAKCGVSGPVTIQVQPGPYQEPGFRFSKYPGVASNRRVTFTAKQKTPTSYESTQFIGVNGSGAGSSVVLFSSGARFITLRGFKIDGSHANNRIKGSFAGPIVFAKGGSQTGIVLDGLVIRDFGKSKWSSTTEIAGIYVNSLGGTVSNIEITRCTITNIAPAVSTTSQSYIAIAGGGVSNLNIHRNRFGSGTPTVIQVSNVTKLTSLTVANNQVIMTSPAFLRFTGNNTATSSPVVVYNSLLFLKAGFALVGKVNGKTPLLRNNIFSSTLASAPTMVGPSTPLTTPGYNCLYKVKPGYAFSKDIVTNPDYLSTKLPFDLHIKKDSLVKGRGIAIPAVIGDFDGQERENPPDIGMDEVAGGSPTAPAKPCVKTTTAKMNGSYTIGSGGDFAKYVDAVNNLKKCGIGGPTTWEFKPGNHYSSVGFEVPYVAGMGSTNRLLIRAPPVGTSYQKVVLTGVTPSGSRRGIVRFAAKSRYVTLEGVKFDGSLSTSSLKSYYAAPVIFDTAGDNHHITLKNLVFSKFTAKTWPVGYSGMVYEHSNSPSSYLTVQGCRFENNTCGQPAHSTVGVISLRGGTQSNYKIVGNRFKNNNVDAINSRDIAWAGLLIANNIFVLKDGRHGMDLYGTNSATKVAKFVFNSLLFLHGSSTGVKGVLKGSGLDVRNNAARGLVGKPYLVQGPLVSMAGYNCLANMIGGYTKQTGDRIVTKIGYIKTAAPFDLHVSSSSPCLNKGLFMSDVPKDIDGANRSKTPDIGADER